MEQPPNKYNKGDKVKIFRADNETEIGMLNWKTTTSLAQYLNAIGEVKEYCGCGCGGIKVQLDRIGTCYYFSEYSLRRAKKRVG